MLLKTQLSNFRNFQDKVFEFLPQTTVIVGPNASGKTNILESLFLLSTGKSFHARLEEEMVNYEEEIARVKGSIVVGGDGPVYADASAGKGRVGTNLEVVLTRGEIILGDSPKKVEKITKKKLLVNGVGKRLIDFSGNFKVVLFGPWDLDLVTSAPSIRRRFLDTVLSQVDREYRRASLSYEKGLRQRNRLLLRIRDEGVHRSQLLFWDKLLIKNGDYISKKREEFIEFVNSKPDFNDQDFSLEYDKSAISEARLEQYKEEEVAAATTLVGPHRDDFQFTIFNLPALPAGKQFSKKRRRNLSSFGSRGEQRMSVLWLKLAELSFIEEKTHEKPTLLLDDIFSELDHEHREIVMEISKNQQTIITTADPHFIEGFEKVSIIKLNAT